MEDNWYDWIDYWSVDFDYESKPEIIKFKKDDGKIEELWTGNYVFENEWQSFRSKFNFFRFLFIGDNSLNPYIKHPI